MRDSRPTSTGFTLVEMVIATAILVTTLSLAMTGYVYLWSETNKGMTQDELDVQVQISIEKVKRDLRLSALEKMFYYPSGAGPYTAISMPLARDDDGDGAVDVDGSGKIIWDKTLIYHVWSGNPNQLRLTTIDPRDNSLTATQMQAQLNSVATVGSAASTYGATNATTKVIFQNLFTWSVQPQSSTYDGYASTLQRDLGLVLGSAILSNGAHTLQFRVTGKNPSASNYRVGLDTLFMSPSYSVREAEAQLPATNAVGATPTNTYMAAGSWSGNYQLYFPATATGQSFTVVLNNDRWEETNFRSTGELTDDTTVLFDTTLTPNDFVLQLDGRYGQIWRSTEQAGDPAGSQLIADNVRGCAVRVLVRGRDLEPGGWIEDMAGKCWIYLRAGPLGSLVITDAFIAEAEVTNGIPSMNAVPGTTTRLKSSTGANGLTLSANSPNWMGYPAAFSISKSKSYLVSYLVSTAANSGNARCWRETNTTGYVAAYMIAATNAPTSAVASADTWSTRSDVYTTNAIPGLEHIFGTYATNGVYTSSIFDTQKTAPAFSTIGWNAVVPGGTYMGLKVRSANSNDMSDAANWTNVTAMTTAGAINPGNKRYVQFQVQMRPDSPYAQYTPKLRDVNINWPGETKMVDIGGTFTKGPDYGIFELLVDGQPLKKGVVVNLEIFDYARAHGSSNRITSAATTEVTPRNSGR